MSQNKTIVGTICYIVHEGRVLLTQRTVPPHVGQWVAPGGRIEFGETPERCIVREIMEETGLTIEAPALRGVTSVFDPRLSLHWLAFIFHTSRFTGSVLETPENPLRWFGVQEAAYPTVPHADVAYLQRVLLPSPAPFFQAEATLGDGGDRFKIWD